MGDLTGYSGICTKIRAMERWRLSESQLKRLEESTAVSEAVEYLKTFPPYRKVLEGAGEELHRGQIEERLKQTLYLDFASLYRFSNLKQRHFLDLYFMHYEIQILKTCLRNGAGRQEEKQELSGFLEFFNRHSAIDLEALSHCTSIGEFIRCLKGTPYYEALTELERTGRAAIPACETAMDMVYFRTMWKVKDKYLSKEEREIITQCFGTRMDMLNLQWIVRAKKYYRLKEGAVYELLIPASLHLKKKELQEMAGAEDVGQVFEIIRRSWYRKAGLGQVNDSRQLERLAREITNRVYERTWQREPYSIAALNSCLYFKEQEAGRIVTAIERIRYGMKNSQYSEE